MIRRGFTLIELLVVITILAILAGAALPYVQNYVAESRIAKAKTDLEEIARALVVYETREGDYTKLDVSDLTGRYLNKSPIDPWGSSYVVDYDSGIVYSKGPDRKNTTTDDKLDNISAPYQPPLALVSAKWVDKNQTGAVDIQNVNDEIHLVFSRKLSSTLDTSANLGTLATKIRLILDSTSELLSANAVITTSGKLIADKTVIFPLKAKDVFTAGQDAVEVIDAHAFIIDRATPSNRCISGQNVVILPQ